MSRVLINGQDVNMTDGFPEMNYDEWKALPKDLRPDFTIIKDRDYTSEPLDNSVSVTADGVKTYGQLLNELFALVDKDRIGRNSILIWNESNQNFIYHTGQNAPSGATYFERATVGGSNWQIISIRLQGASKIYMNVSGSISDVSSQVASSGITITLYYNIVSSGGVEVDAEDVSYGSSNVKVALDALNGYKKGTVELNGVWSSGSWYGIYFAVIPFRNADKATISITTVNTLVNQTLTPTLVSIENQKEDYITIKSETAGIGGYPFALTISVS